ncbi:F-box domain-containing protein [Strongyloides ratti]|uniref:F-box domain-containing protein n=1 Tax=Strongyloides ratti TaxID=34506 RepID=A0A090MUZ5_STRRB|nr:F-box domain-containing protein [Strongyloides ratti]CEF62543.1 F-box domain-containing protein [Strongyloides ratti]
MEEIKYLPDLPKEVLLNIFSYIDWRSINNLMITSKELYFFIKRNFYKFEKIVKLYSLCIEEVLEKNSEKTIQITYINVKRQTAVNSFKIISLKPSELNVFESFLQRVDFSVLKNLFIFLNNQTNFIDVLNRYITCESVFICIKIFLCDHEGNIHIPFTLLSKFTRVKNLSISLDYPLKIAPPPSLFPISNSLRHIKIDEGNGVEIIDFHTIQRLVESNPEIYDIKINSTLKDKYRDIAKGIRCGQIKRRVKFCTHTIIYAKFIVNEEDDCFLSLKNYLQYVDHENVNDFSYYDDDGKKIDYECLVFYTGDLICQKCGEKDTLCVMLLREF